MVGGKRIISRSFVDRGGGGSCIASPVADFDYLGRLASICMK